jgi:hypothetical protein
MDEAWLPGLAPSGRSSSRADSCSGLDGGLAIAGSVLRTLPRSPNFAAPNQVGVSPEASFWDARRRGLLPRLKLLAFRCRMSCWGPRPGCREVPSRFWGNAGTGGISSLANWFFCWPDALLAGRFGLGVRKVRSVIDPLLPRLCSPD